MKKLSLVLATFFTLMLFGCNGHNEDSSQSSDQVVTTVTLSLLDSSGDEEQSYETTEIVTLQAKVTDEDSASISNRLVTFTASIGSLTVSSALTNSSGVASISLTNESLELGAGTITATSDDVSAESIDYEFINSAAIDTPSSVTSVMTLNDDFVNQFKSDESAQITATLVASSGEGIANEIISFSADIGTLSSSTALTNSLGVATVALTSDDDDLGAGVFTSSYAIDDDTSISSTFNYEILSADATIDTDVRLGYFDESSEFVEGIELSIADATVSAGGSLGLSVNVVDEADDLIVTPVAVTFTSNCVENGNATIDESVLSVNGTASSTFTDIDCAGITGTDDVVVASVTLNDITTSVSQVISIQGEELGSIEFVSADPTSIVLKGTGGEDNQETSTLTFRVKSQLGNVLSQQDVKFALSTTVGDITLSRESAVTNSEGEVTTIVSAGTVPTAVRVVASASMVFDGETVEIQTQSDLLSINTGLPEQRSMTIAASNLSPEGHNISGEESTISVWLSDNFHNPVPDGTTVNFTTEGGSIEPSCNTSSGSCSVTWTSAEPRVADHRITILATALGHETFFDTNGNNVFDDEDIGDGPIVDEVDTTADSTDFTVDSGFGSYEAQDSSFIDMSEAWRDDNENSVYDNGETFLDLNNDSDFSDADGLFNGPQCQATDCVSDTLLYTHVRKAIRLVMASSEASYSLTNDDDSIEYQNSNSDTIIALPDVANGGSQAFNFYFADTAEQTMPSGTSVEISVSDGDLSGDTSYTVGNTNDAGFSKMSFEVVQESGNDPASATLTITITTPNDFVTSFSSSINLL